MINIKQLVFFACQQICTAYAKRSLKKWGKGLKVNYPCFFGNNSYVGDFCHFNGMSVSGTGYLKIGNHFHSGSDILILISNHDYKTGNMIPYNHSDIPRHVKIGNFVWLGSKVIILPGTIIGDGCIVQAGSVVHGKIKKLSVIGGNPAKVIKMRDPRNFNECVKKKKFLY